MRYIYYDTLDDEDKKEYDYMGRTYDYVGKSLMGDMEYYIYKISGGETLLIITSFVRQFREAINIFWSMHDVKTNTAAQIRIKDRFRGKYKANCYGEGEDQIWDYTIRYKDIRFSIRLEHHKLEILPNFTIVSGNIFGQFVSVSVTDNQELYKYCKQIET